MLLPDLIHDRGVDIGIPALRRLLEGDLMVDGLVYIVLMHEDMVHHLSIGPRGREHDIAHGQVRWLVLGYEAVALVLHDLGAKLLHGDSRVEGYLGIQLHDLGIDELHPLGLGHRYAMIAVAYEVIATEAIHGDRGEDDIVYDGAVDADPARAKLFALGIEGGGEVMVASFRADDAADGNRPHAEIRLGLGLDDRCHLIKREEVVVLPVQGGDVSILLPL